MPSALRPPLTILVTAGEVGTRTQANARSVRDQLGRNRGPVITGHPRSQTRAGAAPNTGTAMQCMNQSKGKLGDGHWNSWVVRY